MDGQQAISLIKETFESEFNKINLIKFIKNLLKKIEEKTYTYTGNYIPDAYKDSIESLERIGKYNDGKNNIDILIVKLKRESSFERARSMQRNFIAWYLNGSRGGDLKDAALVAYVSPDSEDWRFSLVKMDYRYEKTSNGKVKVKEEFTPARRWSFLVGANEKSHTAQSRFLPLLENDEYFPTLEDLEKAFNIETVSDEFFYKYRELFVKTKQELDKVLKQNENLRKEFESKNIDTVNFTKKLLGQIVFIYFLQKKGWFGVPKNGKWGEGSRNFLRELFEKKHCDYKNFFNDILEPLFYEALRTDRSDSEHYYSRFDCKIPFLNGGLFDPIDNYDWVKTEITLPDELFSNKNKTPEGDIGDGILDIFDRYNFTVNEEEPLDKEVAIDPELLGKTYERFNAIRKDNFDEFVKSLGQRRAETEFNREYGVYYTPRQIVHYMCQESLIEYLHTETNIPKEEIEIFIKHGSLLKEHEETAKGKEENIASGKQKETKYEYKMPESIRNNAEQIDNLLADITICDPAVGSGAFPVGLMYEVVQARLTLNAYLGNDEQRTSYEFKRHFIEKSLYAVDIDPGATEIAKLRLWLSLVVDEEDFYRIKPLPNLDYKIICGDSLTHIDINLFNQEAFNTLEELKPQYLNESNPKEKQELKQQIDKILSEITSGHREFDFKVYFSEVFHQKDGFDIVIGNPPYIQLQKDGGRLAKLYEKQNYQTFARTGDIYCLFYEKGIQLLRDGGHLCFITSNKWMRAGYGEKLREYFTKYNPVILIDLGPGVFENATVDTNILLIQKKQTPEKHLKAVTLQKQNDTVNIEQQLQERAVILEKLTKDAWFIGSSVEQRIKEKIEHIGKPLKDWDVNIYYGIKTGLNEAFIITTEKRNEILANCKDEDERKRTEAIIKPILRGRDIKRYYYEWAGLWVIVIPAGWTNENRGKENAEKFIEKNFPSLMNHLRPFEAKAKNRDDQGDYWWELRHCAYYPEFEKEKVVYSEIVRQPQFYFDIQNFYVEATSFLMTGKNVKYICGLLNSNPVTFFFKQWYAGGGLGEEGYRYKKAFLENLPLPPITPANQPIVSQIEALVDKILTAKKENSQADTSQWEREIDGLVYQLYELTAEEIKIIEGRKNYED